MEHVLTCTRLKCDETVLIREYAYGGQEEMARRRTRRQPLPRNRNLDPCIELDSLVVVGIVFDRICGTDSMLRYAKAQNDYHAAPRREHCFPTIARVVTVHEVLRSWHDTYVCKLLSTCRVNGTCILRSVTWKLTTCHPYFSHYSLSRELLYPFNLHKSNLKRL